MKRNTYILGSLAETIILTVCLGPRKTKEFDYGMARTKNKDGNFIWRGTYSDNPQANEMFEGRLQQLKDLNIRQDKE